MPPKMKKTPYKRALLRKLCAAIDSSDSDHSNTLLASFTPTEVPHCALDNASPTIIEEEVDDASNKVTKPEDPTPS